MNKERKLWIAFILVVGISFTALLYFGSEIYQKAPPLPSRVVNDSGNVLIDGQDIKDGQNVWQSIGGQEVGSVWGHGAYTAPDWTADYIHREAEFILDKWAQKDYGKKYDQLGAEVQASLLVRLKIMIRQNRYDPATGTITISEDRAEAYAYLQKYYEGLFMNDPSLDKLRDSYAIPKNAIKDTARVRQIGDFFFWASWACVTDRPKANITYTHNWPSEKLVGNEATGGLLIWTGVSIILLLIGVGIMAFFHARTKEEEPASPVEDPLMRQQITPSMRAVKKYIWIVALLVIIQMTFGVITAHYGVEGTGLYGLDLSKILPYSVSRTWHVQLGILWIATAWLATGLYIAPSLSGKDPKYQKLGVNFLFICLLIIVFGSMAGQWMGIMQKLGLKTNFWFGHQGYEYVDLGRFWQLFLF